MTDTVTCIARLRVPDGREFDHVYQQERRYADSQEFWWTEGNGACDCNRSSAIGRDHGVWLSDEPQPDDSDGERSLPCGDTITLVSLTIDGAIVYPRPRA